MRCINLLISGLLASVTVAAHAGYVSNFDTGLDGWSGSGGLPAITWQSSGGIGNTGFIQSIDMAGGQMAVVSPSLGNQVSTYGGTLSFGYNVFKLLSGNVYVGDPLFGTVTLSSGSLFVTADLIAPASSNIAGSGWHTTSLGLDDALWSGNATLSTVLANVTGVSIITEYDQSQRYPDEVVGIDSFALAAAPRGVPEPATLALLLTGSVGAFAIRRRRRV